ncbi:sigma 54-interacting transcriptional regulator [Bacillus sp. ISL-4]|uniref:sigma-54 interaction domain-containing protein n=1 Tax=Bacillus sp. ISL-4 TaxID=2819125 RepID=UPI001BEA9E23|nr:sigma 54-interacting transcriptional regulator [Bacillus sp. ISL-4]MBT2666870.1 sigma 54-interacting transcriptional regulator [Bacillus sp. ISL-4]MBT2673537.1 sigma 54-interacting transcriptional regulator [Streptomyces sp. ISL-14]
MRINELLEKVQQLEAINKLMRTIIDFSSDGLYVVDEDGITIEVNKAYEEMTGINRNEVIGKDIKDLVLLEYFDESAAYMALQSKNTTTIMQKINKCKYFVATATPVFDNSKKKVKMIVTSVRDITYLNHLQSQTRKMELDKENDAKQSMNHPLIIFKSQQMQTLIEKSKKIAAFPTSVLITGDSGTGKEVLANYIHEYSRQKNSPFIKVNCAAIPSELFESELFGYADGAFTGAKKGGFFEKANFGTILLDEIGELPLLMQAKLLRVLQDQAITRIGDTRPITLNFRLICSTNKDLRELINKKQFREDLWYRINVVHLDIPPLLKRKTDILPLIDYYLKMLCEQFGLIKKIMPETIKLMESYQWPGNVRELKNILEYLVVSTSVPSILPRDLPEHIRDNWKLESDTDYEEYISPSSHLNLKDAMNQFEAQIILDALKSSPSIRKAAFKLKIDHANLIRRMKRLGIHY